MRIEVKVGDVLEEPADVLVVSANPWLNLSGGVGGAILLRGGAGVQAELHAALRASGRPLAEPGSIHRTGPGPLPFRLILHAVAIDAFYKSSVELVERALSTALAAAADEGARRVACTALATGYGRLSFDDFGRALRRAASREFPPLEEVVVVVRRGENAETVRGSLAERVVE